MTGSLATPAGPGRQTATRQQRSMKAVEKRTGMARFGGSRIMATTKTTNDGPS
jgi:hypothetical protein